MTRGLPPLHCKRTTTTYYCSLNCFRWRVSRKTVTFTPFTILLFCSTKQQSFKQHHHYCKSFIMYVQDNKSFIYGTDFITMATVTIRDTSFSVTSSDTKKFQQYLSRVCFIILHFLQFYALWLMCSENLHGIVRFLFVHNTCDMCVKFWDGFKLYFHVLVATVEMLPSRTSLLESVSLQQLFCEHLWYRLFDVKIGVITKLGWQCSGGSTVLVFNDHIIEGSFTLSESERETKFFFDVFRYTMWTLYWVLYNLIWKWCCFHPNINEPLGTWLY